MVRTVLRWRVGRMRLRDAATEQRQASRVGDGGASKTDAAEERSVAARKRGGDETTGLVSATNDLLGVCGGQVPATMMIQGRRSMTGVENGIGRDTRQRSGCGMRKSRRGRSGGLRSRWLLVVLGDGDEDGQ